MPTLLSWDYDGRTIEFHGVQRSYPGEIGIDDILGEVILIGLDSGDLEVEYTEADGKKVVRKRTFGLIRAKASHDPKPQRQPTGRPGQPKNGIFQFLGPAGTAASPTPQQPKKKGKALGKPVAKRAAAAATA